MNFKKAVVETPLCDNKNGSIDMGRCVFGPSSDLESVLKEAEVLYNASKNENGSFIYDEHLMSCLNDNEEKFRHATGYLKDRFFFQGLMDEFKTTDIIDILYESLTLEISGNSEEIQPIFSEYEDA